jgi:HPt (histidine-containing phosphotransfer) domain-containing protein
VSLLAAMDAAVGRVAGDIASRAPEAANPPLLAEQKPGEIIDEALLEKLIGGDTPLLRELVRIYNETSPELIRNVDHAIANQDGKKLRDAAHALKGAVSNFAATPAVQACAELERMGSRGDLTRVADGRNDLGRQLELLHGKLATFAAAEAARA